MTIMQIIAAAAFAALCQTVALRVATRLMVDVRIAWRLAAKIVAIEYVAIACVAGMLLALRQGHVLPLAVGALIYLMVGAACISRWIAFGDGARVGVGNGVLIQAIQIPLIIPVLIAGSFLFDLQTRLAAG
jgi:ABC-type transport system involved in cytochrome c biogenesis permease component